MKEHKYIKVMKNLKQDFGNLDLEYIKSCYNDDIKNKRIRRQSFKLYLAKIIKKYYNDLSDFTAIRVAERMIYLEM